MSENNKYKWKAKKILFGILLFVVIFVGSAVIAGVYDAWVASQNTQRNYQQALMRGY